MKLTNIDPFSFSFPFNDPTSMNSYTTINLHELSPNKHYTQPPLHNPHCHTTNLHHCATNRHHCGLSCHHHALSCHQLPPSSGFNCTTNLHQEHRCCCTTKFHCKPDSQFYFIEIVFHEINRGFCRSFNFKQNTFFSITNLKEIAKKKWFWGVFRAELLTNVNKEAFLHCFL